MQSVSSSCSSSYLPSYSPWPSLPHVPQSEFISFRDDGFIEIERVEALNEQKEKKEEFIHRCYRQYIRDHQDEEGYFMR